MKNLNETPDWPYILAARKIQRICGVISGIMLTLALLALFDGLLAQMRAGSNTLEILTGSSMAISGPVPIKNPVKSDLIVKFTPNAPAPDFNFEGFFTGYWFGSGMWRAEVHAPEDLPTSEYELRVAFKGASAQSAQVYKIDIFRTTTDLREASHSFLTRIFDLNPFIFASICGIIGLLSGIITYIAGQKYLFALLGLEIVQVYPDSDDSLWCFCPERLAPVPATSLALFDEDGCFLGLGKSVELKKGKLKIRSNCVKAGLVCLKPVRREE